jgi:pyruvate/2-oxoglutarate/acetoin dehydrogenase E1 component
MFISPILETNDSEEILTMSSNSVRKDIARPRRKSRISYRLALNEALAQEMRRDPKILIMGEDIAGGMGAPGVQDTWGGAFGVTRGLLGEFGRDRVLDTPLQESAIIGAAIGAASNGLRPVAELMFNNFIGVCMDQLMNQAPKFRYMFGGKVTTPVTIRTVYGAGIRVAAQHSSAYHALLTHIPGLKVVMPSSPYDAKGLLITAIRDDDPVIFFEHIGLFDKEGDVPEEPYTIPFGEANILREGRDLTLVAFGRMVDLAMAAADNLQKDGIRCTVIDPRTTSPLDEETIIDSVTETGHLVIVDEGNPRCGIAADISAMVADRAFAALKGPIKLVTAPHCHVPFAPELEDAYLPNAGKIEAAVRSSLGGRHV